jgi:hypothetical protein
VSEWERERGREGERERGREWESDRWLEHVSERGTEWDMERAFVEKSERVGGRIKYWISIVIRAKVNYDQRKGGANLTVSSTPAAGSCLCASRAISTMSIHPATWMQRGTFRAPIRIEEWHQVLIDSDRRVISLKYWLIRIAAWCQVLIMIASTSRFG